MPKTQTNKLGKRSCEAMMVGYSENQKGYKLWDTNSKKKNTSRDVKFLETQSNLDETLKLDLDKVVYIDADSRGSFDNVAIRDTDEPTEDLESIIEASQTTTAPDGEHATTDNTADNVTTDALKGGTSESTRTRRAPGQWWANCEFVSSTTDPTTLHQAMKRSDAGLRKDAMKSKYNSAEARDVETFRTAPRRARHSMQMGF
jgi:hypothetical protein